MKDLVTLQRKYYYTGATRDYTFRKKQLQALKSMLEKYEKEMYDALRLDLNKSAHEALITELGILYTEIDFALKHLHDWMKDEKVPTPLTHKGTSNYIQSEPYGVTLVIAPWNYPVQLAIAPIIGAIAAGNTVILKPSELTEATSRLLYDMFTDTFPRQYIAVVEGDKTVSEALLNERFDYIFFTGSTQVGRIIMQAASKYLTPLTLELGGKSPAIIDKDCHINYTAKRIVWGKLTNAGQTCVAPDYLYVHEDVKDKLIKALKKQIRKMYGKDPLENNDYVKIVNDQHFDRLLALLEDESIIHGGRADEQSNKIEPTILDHVSWDDAVMQEEIFGPLFPMLTFTDLDQVIEEVQERDKPLALYYFGENKDREKHVLTHISAGGVCVNDTLYHLANPHLPFGGVGPSGIGAYHGKYSFDTFSHQKSVLKQSTAYDLPVRYPNSKIGKSVAKKIFK